MNTIAPDAPTSHTSARCKASTPGAAVTDGREPSAVAAYAILYSRTHATLRILSSLPATNADRLCKGALATKQSACFGLLRCARNDASTTQYAFSFLVISASGVFSRMKRSNSTDQ